MFKPSLMMKMKLMLQRALVKSVAKLLRYSIRELDDAITIIQIKLALRQPSNSRIH